MPPTNESRRYKVTSSLIGWVHTQKDPCIIYYCYYIWNWQYTLFSTKCWKFNGPAVGNYLNSSELFPKDLRFRAPVTDEEGWPLEGSVTHITCAWFCCALFCCGHVVSFYWIHGIQSSRLFRVASLALGQADDCPSASEVTLKDICNIHWYQTTTKAQQSMRHYRDHFVCVPANERWRYNVTSSLIGWKHSQNDPWLYT